MVFLLKKMKSNLFKKTEFKIFFTIFIIYIFYAAGYGGNWGDTSILYETMAIADKGIFYTDDYLKEKEIEIGNDHAFYNGHFYSGFPPGATFLALPLYIISNPFLDFFIPDSLLGYSHLRLKIIVFNLIAIIFISVIFSALLSVLFYKILKYFYIGKRDRLIITFILAFATLVFVYSMEYHPRIISAFFNLDLAVF